MQSGTLPGELPRNTLVRGIVTIVFSFSREGSAVGASSQWRRESAPEPPSADRYQSRTSSALARDFRRACTLTSPVTNNDALKPRVMAVMYKLALPTFTDERASL